MTTVVLFHHVQGLTDGVLALGAQLRAGGHDVITPDLFDGALPASIEDGIALADSIPEEVWQERVADAIAHLPEGVVWAGISWGVSIAQNFAQTRQGARGALFYEACLPLTGDWSFGPWPDGVDVQIHGMDDDPFFAHEGDLDAAREIVETLGPERAELFTYPGRNHLFIDSSLPSFDADAAALAIQRSLDFLDRLDSSSQLGGPVAPLLPTV